MSRYLKVLFIAVITWIFSAPGFADGNIGGFAQTWLKVNEGTDRTVDDFGLVIPHVRVKWVGKSAAGVKIVVMPEFAGGIQLLNGFGDWNIDSEGVYTLRAGQFKFPFGLNRMYTPGQLNRSNYSMINAALFPGHAWDVGGAFLYKRGSITLDLAVIEGQGPNLTSAAVGKRRRQDYTGRLQFSVLDKKIILGASIYQGLNQKTPWAARPYGKSHTWGGGHLKAKFGKFSFQAEVINRDDLLFGVNAEPSYQLSSKVTILAYYDRVENQAAHALGKTRIGAGLIYKPNSKVEFTFDVQGNSTGSEQEPQSSSAVLQTQFNY